ncbi:ABC transporter ATP-binding protein [Brevibacillus thermoruber]|uniref:Quaternary amine transport ATP-binding protein n=1 Tax=Brevibacillus thermoruber TaxID=33942 RepID=A0A9X3TNS1_9BACL|nr:ABC transporter ATP-binding protein [Brevibacillus thermoruber]MDA5107906.1 ABC transporter ATP-binding protein [Brevibacillus thermoruber]
MGIVFKRVSKMYPGAKTPAVDGVDLVFGEGEFIVFLGPSGCGKTTLLKMVNRLYEPTEGVIEIDGVDISTIKGEELRRRIGYVIQQNGLFPHMRIEDNIVVVPRLLGWDRDRIDKRVNELLEMVHLDPAIYRKRYPRQLSGGQQQRVGIARAMAADPSILLMDEPFGAIDPITRTSLQDELLRIQKQLKKTILFVTHDVDEALRLADRIVVMQSGRVVQVGTPYEILANPANDFVRQLVGERSLFRRMSLLKNRDVLRLSGAAEAAAAADASDPVGLDDSVSDTFARLVETGKKSIPVVDERGHFAGMIGLSHILDSLSRTGSERT